MNTNQFLQEAEKLVEQLHNIIDSEQSAIVSSDPDAIHDSMVVKSELLNRLSDLEPTLSLTLSQANKEGQGTVQIDAIRGKLKMCLEKNRENRMLTVQGLNVIEKSIGFLESVMQTGSTVKVYNTDGKSSRSTVKRNIGTA